MRNQQVVEYYHLLAELNEQIQWGFERGAKADDLEPLIGQFFLSVFRYMGREVVNGGGILLPDKASADWLCFWRMSPDQMISPKRFYVGPETQDLPGQHPRGVAGLVYLDGKPRIVNMVNRTRGEADTAEYHIFDMTKLGHPRYVTPYEAFICLPIHWGRRTVGVLSIESQRLSSFDSFSADMLQPVADCLGMMLFLFRLVGSDQGDSAFAPSPSAPPGARRDD
jgi:hypothetical protein